MQVTHLTEFCLLLLAFMPRHFSGKYSIQASWWGIGRNQQAASVRLVGRLAYERDMDARKEIAIKPLGQSGRGSIFFYP